MNSAFFVVVETTRVRFFECTDSDIVFVGEEELYLDEGFHAITGIYDEKLTVLTDLLSSRIKEHSYEVTYIFARSLFRKMQPSVRESILKKIYKMTGVHVRVLTLVEEDGLRALAGCQGLPDGLSLAGVLIDGDRTGLFSDVSGMGSPHISWSSFGVADFLKEFPDINNDVSPYSLSHVVSFLKDHFELERLDPAQGLLLFQGSYSVMWHLRAPLVDNTLFSDPRYPSLIDMQSYTVWVEGLFRDGQHIAELGSKLPQNLRYWVYRVRVYLAFIVALSEMYQARVLCPSDIDLQDGLVHLVNSGKM